MPLGYSSHIPVIRLDPVLAEVLNFPHTALLKMGIFSARFPVLVNGEYWWPVSSSDTVGVVTAASNWDIWVKGGRVPLVVSCSYPAPVGLAHPFCVFCSDLGVSPTIETVERFVEWCMASARGEEVFYIG